MNLDMADALTILSVAFGVWAWVVAWGVSVIRKEVQDMKHAATHTGVTLNAHVHQTERRLTMLETEFAWIKNTSRLNNAREEG